MRQESLLTLPALLAWGLTLSAGENTPAPRHAYLQVGGSRIHSLAVLGNGPTVVFWHTKDYQIRFWNWQTGETKEMLSVGTPLLAITPDGKTLAAPHANSVTMLWDLATGEKKPVAWEPRTEALAPGGDLAAITPDGKTLVTMVEQELTGRPVDKVEVGSVWDVAAKKRTAKLFLPALHTVAAFGTGTDRVELLAISPDGKTLALVQNDFAFLGIDGRKEKEGYSRILLFDATTGKEMFPIALKDQVEFRCVAFTPDSKSIVAGVWPGGPGGPGSLRMWDLASKKARVLVEGKEKAALSLAFTTDGKYLAAGSEDLTIAFWDLAAGKVIGRLPAPEKNRDFNANLLAFSADGHTLVATDGGSVLASFCAWDIRRWLNRIPSFSS